MYANECIAVVLQSGVTADQSRTLSTYSEIRPRTALLSREHRKSVFYENEIILLILIKQDKPNLSVNFKFLYLSAIMST